MCEDGGRETRFSSEGFDGGRFGLGLRKRQSHRCSPGCGKARVLCMLYHKNAVSFERMEGAPRTRDIINIILVETRYPIYCCCALAYPTTQDFSQFPLQCTPPAYLTFESFAKKKNEEYNIYISKRHILDVEPSEVDMPRYSPRLHYLHVASSFAIEGDFTNLDPYLLNGLSTRCL